MIGLWPVPQLDEDSCARWLDLLPRLFADQAQKGGTTKLPETLYLKMNYKGEEMQLRCEQGWDVYFPNHHSPMNQVPRNDRRSSYAIIYGQEFVIRLYVETDRVRAVYTSHTSDRARAYTFA
jgi:hypothetical protein